MKKLMLVILSTLVVACGSGVSGEYGKADCPFTSIEFESNGDVYLAINDLRVAAKYTETDQEVTIDMDGQPAVFQKDGDLLRSEHGSCKKL
jgi:hypothetical protein